MRKYDLETLTQRGLTETEANAFLDLFEKIKPTNEDLEGFYAEMENIIPFEGGMGFSEALTGLKESMWEE